MRACLINQRYLAPGSTRAFSFKLCVPFYYHLLTHISRELNSIEEKVVIAVQMLACGDVG